MRLWKDSKTSQEDTNGTPKTSHCTKVSFLNKPRSHTEIAEKIVNICQKSCKNETEVMNLNDNIVSLYREIADKVIPRKTPSRKPSRKNNNKGRYMKPKNPWFDIECIKGKRELKRLAKIYGRSPTDNATRETYYNQRKYYRKLIKSKKESYFLNLCSEIEAGKEINWNKFKKLKGGFQRNSTLDAFDFINFCNFFKDLYSTKSLSDSKIKALSADMVKTSLDDELKQLVDKDIIVGVVIT